MICNLRDTREFHNEVQAELGTFVDGGLVAALDGLFRSSWNFTDLRIRYYDTVSANKFPTTVDGLIEQIENFPARMAQIKRGIPLEVTFLQDLYVKSFQYKVWVSPARQMNFYCLHSNLFWKKCRRVFFDYSQEHSYFAFTRHYNWNYNVILPLNC